MTSTISGFRMMAGLGAYSARMRTGVRGATSALSGAAFRINHPSDAVRISFSAQSKEKAAQVDVADQAPARNNSPGIVKGLLGRLSDITGRMAQLRKALDSESMTAERKSAIEGEVAGLGTEFQAITTSREFQRILEVSQGVQSSLQGGSPEGVYTALRSETGLLGDDFLSLVQHGSLYQLGLFSGGLSTISSADISQLSSSSSALESLTKTIGMTLDSLQAPALKTEKTSSVAPLSTAMQVAPLQPLEAIFAGAGEVALALRTYAPADMIKAAMTGVDLGPVSLLTLVSNPTEQEDGEI